MGFILCTVYLMFPGHGWYAETLNQLGHHTSDGWNRKVCSVRSVHMLAYVFVMQYIYSVKFCVQPTAWRYKSRASSDLGHVHTPLGISLIKRF
ncbi:hypothetical protein BDD12DRAFT_811429 [Trichophaea hybrida]|nr:hypothetical protein BDD12DRAFT_811429 [Trichophaea hybrida]